jgi:hypothetical protein
VRLITRGGYNWTDRYSWIVEAARKVRQKRFVLDGEAVILASMAYPTSTPCTPANTTMRSSSAPRHPGRGQLADKGRPDTNPVAIRATTAVWR